MQLTELTHWQIELSEDECYLLLSYLDKVGKLYDIEDQEMQSFINRFKTLLEKRGDH